jgi:Ras-related GTP-binding protein C/D
MSASVAEPHRAKILLLGLKRSGKTSIRQVLFGQMAAKDTFYLERTTKVVKHAYDTVIPLEIWDCPGATDVATVGAPLNTFASLVFVIDIQVRNGVAASALSHAILVVSRRLPLSSRRLHPGRADRRARPAPRDLRAQVRHHVRRPLPTRDVPADSAAARVRARRSLAGPGARHPLRAHLCVRLVHPRRLLPHAPQGPPEPAVPRGAHEHVLRAIPCPEGIPVRRAHTPVLGDRPHARRLCDTRLVHRLSTTSLLIWPSLHVRFDLRCSSPSHASPRSRTETPVRMRALAIPAPEISLPTRPPHPTRVPSSSRLGSPNHTPRTQSSPLPLLSPAPSLPASLPSTSSPSLHPSSVPSSPSTSEFDSTPRPLFASSAHASVSPATAHVHAPTQAPSGGTGSAIAFHAAGETLALVSILPARVWPAKRALVDYNVVFLREGVREIVKEEWAARGGGPKG